MIFDKVKTYVKKCYGGDQSPLEMAVEMGLLPEQFKNYRQKYFVTWDIESLEQKPDVHEDTIVEALQNVVSISVSSNLPVEDQYFVRSSSEPVAATELIKQFIDHLFKLEEKLQEMIPPEIAQAIAKLEELIISRKFSKNQLKLKTIQTYLKQCYTLPCYGFNSAKYDIPCIIGLIFNYCRHNDCEINTIKRGTSYMALTLSRKLDDRISRITFRDVLNYTAPCRLSKYLKQWGSELQKSIFPYSYYSSIEELEAAHDFPPYEAFYSDLTQSNVDRDDYEISKTEFYRRKALSSDHPDHMDSMKDWLRYYNCLDTQPLVQAMENSFEKFAFYFKVDPNMHLSLPTLAFK